MFARRSPLAATPSRSHARSISLSPRQASSRAAVARRSRESQPRMLSSLRRSTPSSPSESTASTRAPRPMTDRITSLSFMFQPLSRASPRRRTSVRVGRYALARSSDLPLAQHGALPGQGTVRPTVDRAQLLDPAHDGQARRHSLPVAPTADRPMAHAERTCTLVHGKPWGSALSSFTSTGCLHPVGSMHATVREPRIIPDVAPQAFSRRHRRADDDRAGYSRTTRASRPAVSRFIRRDAACTAPACAPARPRQAPVGKRERMNVRNRSWQATR